MAGVLWAPDASVRIPEQDGLIQLHKGFPYLGAFLIGQGPSLGRAKHEARTEQRHGKPGTLSDPNTSIPQYSKVFLGLVT